MHLGANPAEILLAESQRLEAFVDFWGRRYEPPIFPAQVLFNYWQRVEIEKAYLDSLSCLRIPNSPGNGQLQELAQKTRELLLDELEERKRGHEKLSAAYEALKDEFWTEEGPNRFDLWGKAMRESRHYYKWTL